MRSFSATYAEHLLSGSLIESHWPFVFRFFIFFTLLPCFLFTLTYTSLFMLCVLYFLPRTLVSSVSVSFGFLWCHLFFPFSAFSFSVFYFILFCNCKCLLALRFLSTFCLLLFPLFRFGYHF